MRPSKDQTFMATAAVMSSLSTCARRKVGAVLVDSQSRIISTGYNGVPRGFVHCTDTPCPGAYCPTGTGLELCEAIHAEQNALLQCRDADKVHALYCTTAPCMTCIKLLLNTKCMKIFYLNEYPHMEAKVMWEKYGRSWIRMYDEEMANAIKSGRLSAFVGGSGSLIGYRDEGPKS